jgi:hypothetical protein
VSSDARVSIAYCGIAYIDGFPTDQWIAHIITGERFAAPGIQPRPHLGRRDEQKSLGYSVEILRQRLDSWFSSTNIPFELAPQVMIAGWHASRRTWRPIIWILEYNQESSRYVVERTPSDYWWFRKQYVTSRIPDRSEQTAEEMLELRAQLRTCHAEDSVERALAKAITDVAMRSKSVGPDCMSIVLSPPWGNRVRIRYLPRESNLGSGQAPDLTADEFNDGSSITYASGPIYFSPWLVLPDRVVPPSRMVGLGSIYEVGDLRIHLETPEFRLLPSPTGAMPTFDFGLVDPALDNIDLSLSFSDAPNRRKRIGYLKSQRRPRDPMKRHSKD